MMRKCLFLLIIAALGMASCKKERKEAEIEVEHGKYKVDFNLSGFAQKTGEISSSHLKTNDAALDTLKAKIDVLYYLVFDASNRNIKKVTQRSTESNFGIISDSLQAGTYTVVITGGKGNLLATNPIERSLINDFYISYTPASTGGSFSTPWNDTYYKKLSVVVSSSAQITVTMDRIVSQLQLKLKDAIPDRVYSMDMVVEKQAVRRYLVADASGSFNQGSERFVYTHNFTAAEKGATNFQLTSGYILGDSNGLDVYLRCYDNKGDIIYYKWLTGISTYANKRTILSGYLFGTTGDGGGFGVSLEDWTGTATNINF